MARTEKRERFSLGFFDRDYLEQAPIAYVKDAEGRSSLLPT